MDCSTVSESLELLEPISLVPLLQPLRHPAFAYSTGPYHSFLSGAGEPWTRLLIGSHPLSRISFAWTWTRTWAVALNFLAVCFSMYSITSLLWGLIWNSFMHFLYSDKNWCGFSPLKLKSKWWTAAFYKLSNFGAISSSGVMQSMINSFIPTTITLMYSKCRRAFKFSFRPYDNLLKSILSSWIPLAEVYFFLPLGFLLFHCFIIIVL